MLIYATMLGAFGLTIAAIRVWNRTNRAFLSILLHSIYPPILFTLGAYQDLLWANTPDDGLWLTLLLFVFPTSLFVTVTALSIVVIIEKYMSRKGMNGDGGFKL